MVKKVPCAFHESVGYREDCEACRMATDYYYKRLGFARKEL